MIKYISLKLATNSSTFVLIVTSILNDAGLKLSSQGIDYLLALTPVKTKTAPKPAKRLLKVTDEEIRLAKK